MNKLKLFLFILFSTILPISYIAIRFKIFDEKVNISFWGIVIILIIIGLIAVMIKYYLDGMKTKYSFLKQILSGLIKVVFPLLALVLIVIWIKNRANNIQPFIESLWVIIGCEIVAICVNPLPKFAFENNIEGLVEISDKIFKRGDK